MARNPKQPDLIAAIATAPGRGGIGVVRLSGTDLASLAEHILRRQLQPRVATLANFHAGDGGIIDQGIALYYPAPRSFTGEDVLELQGHGGPVVLQLLLQRCLELGARLAEPGEFTRRAFLNDKLDLAQAESVADLIEASTAAAARSAVRSLSGVFSDQVHLLVGELIELRTLVEATLDFPDDEVDFLQASDAKGRLARLVDHVTRIRGRAQQGSLLRTGLHVVLAGQPNVGKSSLLNRLAGEERAIVTEYAGTTRDALRETIQVEGIPLHVIDTAGLRDTDDHVERIGIGRAWREIERADLLLLLVDARQGVTADDRRIVEQLPQSIQRVTVGNKSDLAGVDAGWREGPDGPLLLLSARTGDGIELLQQELLRRAGWQAGGEDVFMARERHVLALGEALHHLLAAGDSLTHLELVAEELRLAQEALNRITGEFTPDDLLGEIFGRFCIGK